MDEFPEQLQPLNVLYIEDHGIQAQLVRDLLSYTAPHLRLDHATTVAQALQKLRDTDTLPGLHYDVVLADMQLPDGTGLDILNHVRSQGLPLAVVMLTGSDEEGSVKSALRAGADAYLAKQDDYLMNLPRTLQDAITARCKAARSAVPDTS